MKALIDRIQKDGKCYPGGILKVDKFINHQMDPNLMKDIAFFCFQICFDQFKINIYLVLS